VGGKDPSRPFFELDIENVHSPIGGTGGMCFGKGKIKGGSDRLGNIEMARNHKHIHRIRLGTRVWARSEEKGGDVWLSECGWHICLKGRERDRESLLLRLAKGGTGDLQKRKEYSYRIVSPCPYGSYNSWLSGNKSRR